MDCKDVNNVLKLVKEYDGTSLAPVNKSTRTAPLVKFARCLAAALLLDAALLCALPAAHAQSIGTVTIANVAADTDSVKVQFDAVAGAKDYRLYDTSNPTVVKYAGIKHLQDSSGNYTGDSPNLEIEWNGMTPGTANNLIVEAVDAVGPTSKCTLADGNNSPLFPDSVDSIAMLGIDEGETLDGNFSINGQGPYNDAPNVIARSAAFSAEPSGTTALPSGTDATQVLFDNFTNATFTPVGTVDPVDGNAQYDMKSDIDWDVIYKQADTTNSKPFVMDHHYMDVLFDGGTPGANVPLHIAHGVMALSPKQTIDFSGGQIAHFTMEVDSHTTSRRWVAFNLAPATDPLTNWYNNGPLNISNQAFFVQILPTEYAADVFNGTNPDGTTTDIPVTGALGQAPVYAGRTVNGLSLDDRSRFDLFLSQTHFQLFENDVKVAEADIPNGGLPFQQAKVYYTHYAYHSALGEVELQTYDPYESYWINSVSYSDERHWDNIGYEVLPSTTAWSSLASRITSGSSGSGGSGGTGGSGGGGTGGGGTGGSGGNGGSNGKGAITTASGTITAVSSTAGDPTYVTFIGSSGTLGLRTPDPRIAALAGSAYASKTTVTVTYNAVTNDPNATGRIISINFGQ